MNKPIDTPLLARGAPQVGSSRPHESAHLHVAGEAAYIDDLPELTGTLHCALGLSPVAHGRLKSLSLDGLRALPGVVAVLTSADIPGPNDCGSIIHDDPILAEGELRYLGQPVFAVIATTRDLARRTAARARDVLQIEPLPPVLTPQDAHAKGHYVLPPMHLLRGDARQAIDAAPHRLKGTFDVGGQEQFYLEGQISYAIPKENDGMLVHCSTQHPSEMQHLVAHALKLHAHHVQVECRRMGGGFGGKESQSALFACVAAVAARKLNRPVKLRLDRDDDFLITGRRHCFWYEYEAGYDDEGRILGAEVTMVSRAGHSADLSGPVMTRALCHFDNAYWLPDVAMHGYSGKTNTQSNTAFRGFGGPQGAIAIENILDSVARTLGKDPLDVRRANFYGQGQSTPYGQKVEDNVIHELVAELEAASDYRARRRAVAEFNATSPLLKRGLALTPVKFGISFNVRHFNQAGALVHVYNDGSILVNHGGTEMGQGLNTKVAQVVAHELGVDLASVRVTATDTQKIANTSATAASTGSDLNGKAAQDAARQIRERLAACAAAHHGGEAAAVCFADGHVQVNGRRLPFSALVAQAYQDRVQLWSDGFYATPGLSWDRETLQGRPFYYFAYGAAVSEVLVDTLTGEWKLLRADVLHDVGRSLNPAIDIGQVEGAFIQGMGWLTMEELVWHPQSGKLLTHAPSTYKIPTANDCPPVFNVKLFENDNVEDSIHRSKAVGEPPLLLPFSVFYAIRDAVSAVGGHRVDPPLSAPATSESILRAITAVRRERGVVMNTIRDTAAAWLVAGTPAVLVEVTEALGSAPREAGTRMLVSASDCEGTIGGGHLELKAIERARRMLAAGDAAPQSAHYPLGPALGQCCGGAVTLGFSVLEERTLVAWPLAAPRFHLQLFGAGHVGRAIVRALAPLNVRVDWIDEREAEFPSDTALPAHTHRVCVDTIEAEVSEAPRGAFYLVLTHQHDLDLRITEAILRRGDFGFLGLIGSQTKRARFIHRLESRGIAPEAIARMTCPIGVPGIPGKEPEVIAAAVVAQLLQAGSSAAQSAAKARRAATSSTFTV